MSGTFKSHDVAERALRKVSAFSINDTGADPAALEESLYWLDMVIGHTVAVNPLPWLWPIEVAIDLVADQASYDFNGDLTATDDEAPDFAITAHRIDSGGNIYPLEIISRKTFDALQDPDLTGPPERIYINRLPSSPKVFIHPIPDDTEYDIHIGCQVFAPDVTSKKTNTSMGLAAGFELWAVTRVASELGDGPIVTLRDTTIRRWKSEAQTYLNELLSNHVTAENHDENRVVYRNL